jgi:uncharacterized protein (TIGR02996 family)
VISGPDDLGDRRTFAQDEVTIGRAAINDLVLDHPSVAKYHASVLADARGFFVGPQFDAVVRVNGTLVRGHQPCAAGDRIQIGEVTLVIELVPVEVAGSPDEIEASLIAAIESERDLASRQVYADWLEERGHPARAEFIRLELALSAMSSDAHDQALVRLRDLATAIDVSWRMRLANPRIGCSRSDCPRDWNALELTATASTRKCSVCSQTVHYCLSNAEADTVRRARALVALDPLPDARWAGNERAAPRDEHGRALQCRTCGFDLSKVNRSLSAGCPRCGGQVD